MTPEQASAFARMVAAANDLARAATELRNAPTAAAAKEERERAGTEFRAATEAYRRSCEE